MPSGMDDALVRWMMPSDDALGEGGCPGGRRMASGREDGLRIGCPRHHSAH